jgi:hypothetical protein
MENPMYCDCTVTRRMTATLAPETVRTFLDRGAVTRTNETDVCDLHGEVCERLRLGPSGSYCWAHRADVAALLQD